MKAFKILFSVLFMLMVGTAFGQSHEDTNHHKHEFKHFRAAFNLAHAYIPSATISDKKFVIIPVIGLDFQYLFNKKWAIGLKNDLEIANYIVENSENFEKNITRETPIIISLPVYFSPWENNGVTFFMGAGIELEQHENFSVFRFGVGYDLHLGHHWDVAPEIVYDLKNGHINSFTMAFVVGKSF